MRNIKALLLLFSIVLFLFPVKSVGGVFEEVYGLRPATIIIADNDIETYDAVREILKYSDVRGLVHMPPKWIFGYFPAGISVDDFENLDVEIVSPDMEVFPSSLNSVDRTSIIRLGHQEQALKAASESHNDIPGHIEDLVIEIPEETKRLFERTTGPITGSPSEVSDRGMNQNSEFMIGHVLINVLLPESGIGGSEDWTQDEIDNMMADLRLGLSQYQQATHWVDLEFHINFRDDFSQIPVSIEPIAGDMSTDPIWIDECMQYLSALGYFTYQAGSVFVNTHLFNNSQREEFDMDWVFTTFLVDASFNECWQGPGGGYTAYAALGGPYDVVPYPACRMEAGLGFGHVFIHEMSHIFWALDEYSSAGTPCHARSGYLNTSNGNSYAIMLGQQEPCGAQLDCIMNNATLSAPLPICPWTMGQIGLGDLNENNVPDVYDIPPIVEMIYMPGISSDTTFDGSYILSADASNAAVENLNPRQNPLTQIDYAPWLKKGWRQINENLVEEILPVDGKWDGSRESLNYFLNEGLEPGDNLIYFIVENSVGLQASESVEVTYVGMKYYQVDTEAGSDYIDISWITANQVFGAEFDISRKDVTGGTDFVVIGTVDGNDPSAPGTRRNYYIFRDEDVQAMHTYEYQISSRINWLINGVDSVLIKQSGVYPEKSLIPVVSGILSPVAPNPLVFSSHDKVEWTVKLPGEFPDLSSSGGRENVGTTAADDKIMLQADIYNINGQRVRQLYALPVYGGRYKDMVWDGRNDRGQRVANGIYFLKVIAGGIENVKKVVVLR